MNNMSQPRTIQIFLPSGDPAGIRVAELTTSILRLIEVPRNQLAAFLKMEEAHQVGLYFLVAEEDGGELYIGQSGDVGRRLEHHIRDESKDWWEKALVLVSLTNSFTQTHVLYLEHLAIAQAKACARYKISNANQGQRPHAPLPLQADCHEIHRLGNLLLATLGYPIFEPLINETSNNASEQTYFYLRRSGIEAKGVYTNEGMVVLKGSQTPLETQVQVSERLAERRQQLVDNGILVQQGDMLVFTQDHLFKSPSGASGVLLQGASNGWVDWRTDGGKTLREYQEEFLD